VQNAYMILTLPDVKNQVVLIPACRKKCDDQDNMKTYFVYILLCSDNSFYTGVTNNLTRRLHEHQTGINSSCYTYTRRPVKLMRALQFNNPNDAISAEKQIKGWSRKKKEALINGDWCMIHEFSICSNESSHKNYVRPSFD